jgi:hypothetical protein
LLLLSCTQASELLQVTVYFILKVKAALKINQENQIKIKNFTFSTFLAQF